MEHLSYNQGILNRIPRRRIGVRSTPTTRLTSTLKGVVNVASHILPQNDSDSQRKSTLAPTENHLEDWIVANLSTFGQRTELPARRIVARQYECQTGYADLILACHASLAVVELKKGEIDLKAIGQVLKYTGLLYGAFETMFCWYVEQEIYQFDITKDLWRPAVWPVLIGNSASEAAIWACRGAGIDLYLYEYEDNDYQFWCANRFYPDATEQIQSTEVGMAIKELMRHRHLIEYDVEAYRLVMSELLGGAK